MSGLFDDARTAPVRSDHGHVDDERAEDVVGIRVHRHGLAPLIISLEQRQPTVLIGRSNQVDLRLHDDRISRVHALLRRDGRRWTYVDLGSGNGSHVVVAGEPAVLRAGESIALCPGEAIHLANGRTWLEPLTVLPHSDVNASTRSTEGLVFEARLASAATSKLPVFLHGRSGSGKTWAAQVLHERSGRRGRFIAINCARLPTDMAHLHSELLGHVRAAFTGASDDRLGQVFAADNGTLFLDEVDSLSSEAQGFLLDVLDGKGVLLPFGMAPTSPKVPHRPLFRVVAASKNELVNSRMRGDLCERLTKGEIIAVPTLAARNEDIPGFIEQARLQAEVDDEHQRPVFSREAIDVLCADPWPGEVRALRATVTVLVDRAARSGKRIIDVDAARQRLAEIRAAFGPRVSIEVDDDDDDDDNTGAFRRHPTVVDQGAVSVSVLNIKPSSRHATLEDVQAALTAQGNNIDRTAVALGWSRNTLTRKMDELGIVRPGRTPR